MTSQHIEWSTVAMYVGITVFCVSFWLALVIAFWSWS
jgi:hypothetical protein